MDGPVRLSSSFKIQGIGKAAFHDPVEPARLSSSSPIEGIGKVVTAPTTQKEDRERRRDAHWCYW